MTDVDNGRQSVKSLFKMLEVLEAFSATEPELSVVEIARATGLPRTTVHRIVDSLRTVGFLEQDASRDRYRLGLKLLSAGIDDDAAGQRREPIPVQRPRSCL